MCGIIYSALAFFCLVPKNSVFSTQNNYENEPYYSDKTNNLNSDIIVNLFDTPFCFLLCLDSYAEKFEVLFFTTDSIKNSSEYFNTEKIKESSEKFFGITPKRTVTINSETFAKFIDILGGISAETTYGQTSPSNPDKCISLGEEAHFFGDAVIHLITDEPKPEYNRFLYYAEITALFCDNLLKSFNQNTFEFLVSNCKTDISYIDYYNNSDTLSLCAKNVKYFVPKGVWMNDKYYLQ